MTFIMYDCRTWSYQSPSFTYSITMHRCLLLSKLHYIETTKGLSVKVKMSLSANTCSTWWNVQIRLHLNLLQRIYPVFFSCVHKQK